MTNNKFNVMYNIIKNDIKKSLNKFKKSKGSIQRNKTILKNEIEKTIDENYSNMSKIYFKRAQKESSTYYTNTLNKFKNRSKIDINNALKKINSLVKNIVYKKIANLTTKQRFFRNKNQINSELRKIINRLPNDYYNDDDIKEISTLISKKLDIDKNKAIKIVSTEIHRIREESNFNAMEEAEKAGAIFNRKWLATLLRTRDTHIRLHQQLADKDGYFYSSGGRTKYPGGFGIAKEDIFCRCTVIPQFE